MGSIFEGVATVKQRVVTDKPGYIHALLSDIPNTGDGLEYDEWLSLVSLLKYEVDDQELAFEMFDEFSSRSSIYDESFTYTKWHDAQYEGTGQISLGTLIYILKRELGDKYDRSKYAKFFGSEDVSKVAQFQEKLKAKAKKNKMPDHFLLDGVIERDIPKARMAPEIALGILLQEGEHYGTAIDPRQCEVVNPYAGDTLQQYITVNPIQHSRKQSNVTQFRHAVVEFDTIPVDEQFSVLSSVALPYEAFVFTGNKSIHAWVRVDAPDLETYKKRTRLINKMFSDFGYSKELGKGPDTAVLFDCASLVRCPGVTRVAWNPAKPEGDGVLQDVIWCDESSGWDAWYNSEYRAYVVESSLEEVEGSECDGPFTPPKKDHNFSKKRDRFNEVLEMDYNEVMVQSLKNCEPEELEKTLSLGILELFELVIKKTKGKFVPAPDLLYHCVVDAVAEGGCHFLGDIRELLWTCCQSSVHYLEEQKAQRKEKLEKQVTFTKGLIHDYVDPELLKRIEQGLSMALEGDNPDDYEKICLSVERMFEDMDYRPAVYQHAELYKYSEVAGEILSKEFEDQMHNMAGSLYVYNQELHAYWEKELRRIDNATFPSFVTPFMCFIKQNKCDFKVVPLDNDTAHKLLRSPAFLKNIRPVELISDVPVFKELDNGAELIEGYDRDKGVLITEQPVGYGFMELEEAKRIIIGLFDDFAFVDASDMSRAVAGLLTPALCHSDLLLGGPRPVYYIDADSAGAGKGVMANIMTMPYTDHPALITQDDSSIGSIDDKVGNALLSGKTLLILDNLKPSRKEKELSSAFLEGLITTGQMEFRSAGQKATTLEASKMCMYLTTNGMAMSKDMASRSLYISIRKRDKTYKFKSYSQGLERWIVDNRAKIMSAIYTLLKEYVRLGKPTLETAEGHRFNSTVSILNYIIMEILGLPDVTKGIDKRTMQKSDKGSDVVRSICFAIQSAGMLGEDLNNLQIFEILAEAGLEYILDLGSLEIYSDEGNTNITTEAKRIIGQKLSYVFSRPNLLGRTTSKKEESSCVIEEFTMTRTYDLHTRGAKYKVEINGK